MYINPYTKEVWHSKLNKNSKGFTLTLEQLEAMNLSPITEIALFGRTSKDWRKSLDAQHPQENVNNE